MKKNCITFIKLLCIAYFCAITFPVFADTENSGSVPAMQVTPVIEELKIGPSDIVNRNFSVTNLGDKELKIRVYTAPYSISSETGVSDYEAESEFTQIYHWLKIEDLDLNLKDDAIFAINPGGTKTINYRINVPDSAPGGSQHACIFVETVPDQEYSNGIMSVSRTVVKIFADVSGETINDAEIVNLNSGTLFLDGKVLVSATVKNIGNIDIKPALSVKINSLGGETIFSDTGLAMIFPEDEARIDVDWSSPPAFGIYVLVASVNILGKNMTVEKIIFIFPGWFIFLFILLVIVIIILILRMRRKNKRKRAVRH